MQGYGTTKCAITLFVCTGGSEAKHVLFAMFTNESLVPNKMCSGFYKYFLDVIGDNVVELFRGVFAFGKLPNGINHTHIVLISKKENKSP